MKNSNPDSRSCQIQVAIKSWAGITNNLLKKSQKNLKKISKKCLETELESSILFISI